MPTDIPIRVTLARNVWRIAETTEYELTEALKHMLLKCIVDKNCRTDFEYILSEIGEFAESICNETESQWFCMIGARLKSLFDELLNLRESGGTR